MKVLAQLRRERRGVAVVEFALVLPLLVLLLLGVLGYGQYFLLAHSAQQFANDAARATVAGLTAAERVALANQMLARELGHMPEIRPGTVALAIDETADIVAVRVRLDASFIPLFRVPILPMPDALITRRAVVRRGGVA